MSTTNETKAITVVLDESGSMESLRDEAIGGFNTWLKTTQEALKGRTVYLTVMKFDTEYHPLAILEPLADFKPLTRETYTPDGFTALYDAVASTMTDSEVKAAKRKLQIDDWLCVILTDGAENSSREWTMEAISNEIRRREADNWEFIYLSSDSDAWAHGAAIGVSAGSTYSHTPTSQGTAASYASVGASTANWTASDSATNKARRAQGVSLTGDTAATALDETVSTSKPYVPERKDPK